MRRYIECWKFFDKTYGAQRFAATREEAIRHNQLGAAEPTLFYAYNRAKYGQLEHINNLMWMQSTGQISGGTHLVEFLSFETHKLSNDEMFFPIRGGSNGYLHAP